MASDKEKKDEGQDEQSGRHRDTTPQQKIAHSLGLHEPFPKRIKPEQRPKVGLLALLMIGSSILTWFFYHNLLSLGVSASASHYWFWILGTFVTFFLTTAFAAIVALLVHERIISRSIFLLAAFGHLVWFQYGWYSFASLVLVLIGLWQYDYQVKEEESLRIRFSVVKSMRHGLTTVIALFLLAVSLTFYAHTIRKNSIAASSLNPLTEIAGNTVNQVIALQVPQYDPKATVDDFFLTMLAGQSKAYISGEAREQGMNVDFTKLDLTKPGEFLQQFSQIDFSPVIGQLPPELQSQIAVDPNKASAILAEQADAAFQIEYGRFRNKILSDLQINATGSTPLGDVVKQLVGKLLNELLGPYGIFVPPLLALTIFFALSIFTFLYALIIKGLASLLFVIFKATHFVEIHSVTTEVEIATLGD